MSAPRNRLVVGGPLAGEYVSSVLGQSWPYCLTPFYNMRYDQRVFGTYELASDGTYQWKGVQ